MEHFRVVKVVQPAMASLGVLLPHTTPGLARSCQVSGLLQTDGRCAQPRAFRTAEIFRLTLMPYIIHALMHQGWFYVYGVHRRCTIVSGCPYMSN
jgi:hypothetical protein